MNPDWNDAPGWAQWVAMDSRGIWHWFELKPKAYQGGLWIAHNCRARECRLPRWDSVCQPRPTTENEQ